MKTASAFALLLAAVPLFAQQSRNPFAGNEQAVAEGREIYNRVCTACHGYDGGEGERAPGLDSSTRRYRNNSDAQLFDAIAHGIPDTQMPASGLSETEAWKVAGFLRSLRTPAIEMPAAGNVAHGEDIYWNKGGCGGCHMLRGKGGLTGPDLSNLAAGRTLKAIREALTQVREAVAISGIGRGGGLTPAPRFQAVRVVTREGRTVSGVIRNEDSSSLQIFGSDGAWHMFLRDELREVVYEPKSPMPTDYDKRLTSDEMRDLLAFLSRQGGG